MLDPTLDFSKVFFERRHNSTFLFLFRHTDSRVVGRGRAWREKRETPSKFSGWFSHKRVCGALKKNNKSRFRWCPNGLDTLMSIPSTPLRLEALATVKKVYAYRVSVLVLDNTDPL